MQNERLKKWFQATAGFISKHFCVIESDIYWELLYDQLFVRPLVSSIQGRWVWTVRIRSMRRGSILTFASVNQPRFQIKVDVVISFMQSCVLQGGEPRPIIPNRDTITCYQSTCLPADCFKQVGFFALHNFPSRCCCRPNLFEMCCWQQFQNELIFTKRPWSYWGKTLITLSLYCFCNQDCVIFCPGSIAKLFHRFWWNLVTLFGECVIIWPK